MGGEEEGFTGFNACGVGGVAAHTVNQGLVFCAVGNLEKSHIGQDTEGENQARDELFQEEKTQQEAGRGEQDDTCAGGEPAANFD